MLEDDRFVSVLDVVKYFAGSGTYVEADIMSRMQASGYTLLGDVTNSGRTATVLMARLLSRKDPLSSNAHRIWEDFVVGSGITIDISEDAEKSANSALVKDFTKSPSNRRVLSAQGQLRSYRTLLKDGEVYFIVYFGSLASTPVIRVLSDSIEFLDPVCHPDDKDTILYFVRTFYPTVTTFNAERGPVVTTSPKPVFQYIRNWSTSDEVLASSGLRPPSGQILSSAVCVRFAMNEELNRGYPMSESALPWLRAFKGLAEDRITISRSMARYSWRLRAEVNQSQLSALMNKLEGNTADHDTSGAGAGKVFGANSGVTMEPMKASSGGQDAYSDLRVIRQNAGAGVGITEPNLTGDPSVGSLASLTQMDAVMEKCLVANQQLMKGGTADILSAVMTRGQLSEKSIAAAITWVDSSVRLSYQPVVQDDVSQRSKALVLAAPHLPKQWTWRTMLRAFGESDPESILEEFGDPEPVPLGPANWGLQNQFNNPDAKKSDGSKITTGNDKQLQLSKTDDGESVD